MSEFKVGDRVRIKSENLIGKIREISVSGVWFDIETRTNKTTNFYDISVGNKNYIVRDYDLELIERAITNEQIKLEQLEQRIEKLEKCVVGGQFANEVYENVSNFEKMTQKSLLTEDERVILRNLNKMWKWIARDKYGELNLFVEEPYKENWSDCWQHEFETATICIEMFNHIFHFIKWEDEKPYNIEELLKGECGNE